MPAEAVGSAQTAMNQLERRRGTFSRPWVSFVTLIAAIVLQSLFFWGAHAAAPPSLQGDGGLGGGASWRSGG